MQHAIVLAPLENRRMVMQTPKNANTMLISGEKHIFYIVLASF
jgi:hypothetical protein